VNLQLFNREALAMPFAGRDNGSSGRNDVSATPSFAQLVDRLRAGDDDAATRVIRRFGRALIRLARQQLDSRVRQKCDPEDVVQSVYRSFFARCRDGQFDFPAWDGLWGVLSLMTIRKCANRAEHFHAACRDAGREVDLEGRPGDPAWQPPDRQPTPAEATLLTDLVERLMRDLDQRERHMLSLSLQGYTAQEISPQVGRSERTVERLLGRVHKQLLRMQTEDT
jgi:RNA polymerase sigma-70 factor (ECF subfamily)